MESLFVKNVVTGSSGPLFDSFTKIGVVWKDPSCFDGGFDFNLAVNLWVTLLQFSRPVLPPKHASAHRPLRKMISFLENNWCTSMYVGLNVQMGLNIAPIIKTTGGQKN